jgi:hypothetical protein
MPNKRKLYDNTSTHIFLCVIKVHLNIHLYHPYFKKKGVSFCTLLIIEVLAC